MISSLFKNSRKTALVFLCVGLVVATFQFITFDFLLNTLGFDYLNATSTSFFLTVVVSFFLQKYITFRQQQKESSRRISHAFIFFSLNSLFGLIINGGIMFIGVEGLGISVHISQIISMAFLAIYNFFVYRVLLR